MDNQPDVTAVESDDATEGNSTVLTGAEESNSDADVSASNADDSGNADDSTAGNEGDQNTPPETYADFAVPEGIEIDAALLGEATPLFKELGLNQEQAQKLVDFQAKQVEAGQQRQVDAFDQLKKDWGDQAAKDQEIGGDKFQENVGVARKAMEQFGTPELSKLMNDYGVGNHPEIIRFMYRVGQTLREDVPGASTSAASQANDRLSILYPTDAN